MQIPYHVHSFLVHFPISLCVLGCLIVLISFIFNKRESSLLKHSEYLLYLSVLFVLTSIIIGKYFVKRSTETLSFLSEWHKWLAISSITLLIITSFFFLSSHVWKRRKLVYQKWGLVFYVLSTIAIIATAASGFAIM